MMRVLMMVSWFDLYIPNDIPISFHYEQALGLKQLCDIAIYYPYDKQINSAFDKNEEGGVCVYRSKYQLENKIRNRYYMYHAMKKIVREFSPDIIHAQVATEAGRFAIVLGFLFHIPVMITEHSSPDYSGVNSFPHHMYANFAYRFSKYNACVSDYVTQKLQQLFPKYSFHTVYNGIPDRNIDNNTGNYYIKGFTNICLVAGLYDIYIKGIPTLLNVIQDLKKNGYQIVLHIVGGGEYLEYFKDMAKKLEISDICLFHGSVNKDMVYKVISQMDFLVSSSQVESFGCSIAEATILGKPVVATDCGGPASIVNNSNGILVEKGNAAEIKSAIIQMQSSYQTYNSAQIRKNAIDKYGIKTISKQYFDIYQDILNRQKDN